MSSKSNKIIESTGYLMHNEVTEKIKVKNVIKKIKEDKIEKGVGLLHSTQDE